MINEILEQLDLNIKGNRWFDIPPEDAIILRQYIKQLKENNLAMQEEMVRTWQKLDNAKIYNKHLMRDAKYHLNLGHLKKLDKILNGE